jgi:Xylose isomerase-like TIM barrel.
MNEMNNFSVMSYSFHGLQNVGAMNLFGYLESVRYRFGLRTADIWNGFIQSYDDDYIEMVRQNIEERGLTVVNLCCDEAHIWDRKPEVMEANEKKAWDCLKLAKAIGAKTIRIDAGVRDEVFSDEQLEYVSNKYKEYCAYAAEFGAKVGTENHWGVTRNFEQLHRLFDAMKDTENFGHMLHMGNWDIDDQAQKDKYDLAVIPKAMHTHIDYEHCMRAEEIMPNLLKAGYTGCWSVEHHSSTNEYNNVALQLAQIKRFAAPLNYQGQWDDAPPSVKE